MGLSIGVLLIIIGVLIIAFGGKILPINGGHFLQAVTHSPFSIRLMCWVLGLIILALGIALAMDSV